MALTSQEEQQLRELLNNTTPLKDQSTLDVASEAATAILGAVHNDTERGRLRKLGMAILHQALQAANPLQIKIEDTTLFENPSSSVRDAIVTNLDIKQGVTRHNFDDGYFAFTFVFRERTSTDSNPDRVGAWFEKFISKDRWFATQLSNTKGIYGIDDDREFKSIFFKVSNTSFGCKEDSSPANPSIKRIIGHKLILSLETPA